MGKRRVISLSLVLAVFFLIVLVANVLTFEGFTGFVVSKPNATFNEKNLTAGNVEPSFNFEVQDYQIQAKQIKFSYSLEDLIGKDRLISANFRIFNGAGTIKEGSQEVFLTAGSRQSYSFVTSVPNEFSGISNLTVIFSDGSYSGQVDAEGLAFSDSKLSADAVLESGKSILPRIVLVLAAVFVMFFAASKFYHKKNSLNALKRSFDSKFIRLDLKR